MTDKENITTGLRQEMRFVSRIGRCGTGWAAKLPEGQCHRCLEVVSKPLFVWVAGSEAKRMALRFLVQAFPLVRPGHPRQRF